MANEWLMTSLDVRVKDMDVNWRALRLLNIYRLILSLVFFMLFVFVENPSPLGSVDPRLFVGAVIGYFVLAIASFFTIHFEKPRFNQQVYVQKLVDMLAIVLMMHASGGVGSGLGLLLVVAFAGAGILVDRRAAVAIAAAGAIVLIVEQVYAYVVLGASATYFAQAGLLGGIFFVTAILANELARRVRESEALAEQRGIDLANLTQLNESIIQRMSSGVIVVDHHNNYIHLMNEAAWYLLGMPGKNALQSIDKISPELLRQLNDWRQDSHYECKIFRSSGTIDVYPRFTRLGAGALIILEDSTVMHQQAQHLKLAALGRLTASIAHEIRNPLGAISHAAQLLEESSELSQADQRLSQIVRVQSVRVNRIIENVMQLSRRDHAQPKAIVLRDWLLVFINEYARVHDVDLAKLTIDIQPSDVTVWIDPSHLHQIVTNLCQNGLLHGSHQHGGRGLALRGGEARELRGPFLDVIDFGRGISPDMVPQIFEPFFTTKTTGTGLGLYIARELCESNQGHLEYLPIPTGGSCFRVLFKTVE